MTFAQKEITVDLSFFLRDAYRNHDPAHSIDHIKRVMDNAVIIMHLEPDTFAKEDHRIYAATLALHDARDHKLIDRGVCLPQAAIDEFYAKHFTPAEIERIKFIHANCSWTNRNAKIGEGNFDDPLLHLVRDADWLDALGDMGIKRVNEFQRWKTPGITQKEVDIILREHIKGKLLLVPGALKYAASRALVEQRDLIGPLERFLSQV